MGLAFICIGRRKTGKTTMSKNFLKKTKLPIKVYDINNEYKQYYSEPFEDFDVFLEKLKDVRGHYILIEEATIFFNTHAVAKEMTELLVRARHTRNIIQLNFHSFKSVPKNIYNLLDDVIIFKTNDTIKDVKDKFDNPKVLKVFEEARLSDNQFFCKTVSLY